MRRSLLVVATSIALVGGLSACSEQTGGTATPIESTTGEPGPTSEPPGSSTTKPPKTSGSTGPVADLEPCDLVSSSASGSLGLSDKTEDKIGRGRACIWQVRKATSAESLTLFVVVYDTLGLSDIVADGTPKPLAPVGDHKTVQYVGAGGSTCALALEVAEKSRVDVQVTGSDQNKACAFAAEAATLVEPELP